MKPLLHLLCTMCFAGAVCGCATGPVRYLAIGDWRYFTVEWTKKAPSYAKPAAAVSGIAADSGIMLADGLCCPLGAVAMAGALGLYGPDPDFDQFPPGIKLLPVGLLWFTYGLLLSPYLCWESTIGFAQEAGHTGVPTPDGTPPAASDTPPTASTPTPGPLPQERLRK
jgi:hypothetical protein